VVVRAWLGAHRECLALIGLRRVAGFGKDSTKGAHSWPG